MSVFKYVHLSTGVCEVGSPDAGVTDSCVPSGVGTGSGSSGRAACARDCSPASKCLSSVTNTTSKWRRH